jgi:hypothetical protein
VTPPAAGTQTTTGPGSLGPLLAGSASSALELAGTQHGHAVRGSVAVSDAASGGTLEVALLAARASLASAGHHQKVQVGRTDRSSLRAGTVTFAVALDARARRALRVHGRLALTVKILLTSAHGTTVTLSRHVLVRG